MRDAAQPMTRCRGLGTLMVIVLLAGCTALGVGPTPTPDASGSPAVTAAPSGSATTAEPAPGATSPSASPTATSSGAGTSTPTATTTPDPGTPAPTSTPTPELATPEVSGTARVGRTLTGTVAEWGPGEVELAWQWYRGEEKIPGATGQSYRLVASDEGRTIRLRVRGHAANFESASRYSEPTPKVAPGILDPTPVPLYSGTARVGHAVTALPREWGPGDVEFAYQWYRSGADGEVKLEGATKVKYTFVAADEGHQLKVRVSGSKPGFTTVRKYSAWTSVVDPGDLDPATPKIRGAAVSGAELTAKPGEWEPEGVKFQYQWYRSNLRITRATDDTYTVSGADVGHRITVRVTGTLDGYRDVSVNSAATGVVVARER